MISRATVKIKIIPIPEIIRTLAVYKKSLQFCVNFAWKNKIKNKIALHYAIYYNLKKRGLQAQLIICCCRQAIEIVKKAKSKPIIKNVSMRYNFPRSASFKNNILSLSTIKGRVKIPFNVPDCYKEYFTWKVCESLLKIDKQGRCFFLFAFSKEVDVKISTNHKVLGIDFGINNLAVTSDSRFFKSAKVKQIKRNFKFLRNRLQSKGTRSSKRHLKRLSGRENRWMTWINHNISKDIVSNFDGNKIVMENLKGIRKCRKGKIMNYWLHNWSFYQLQKFIQYKAERKGVVVERVNPYMTSQICSRCGKIGVRSKGSFSCLHCGLSSYSADLNSAQNLSHPNLVERQANVTSPNIQMDDFKDVLPNIIANDIMDKRH